MGATIFSAGKAAAVRLEGPWPELAGSWRLEGPWVRPRLGGGHWPLQAGRGEDSSIHCPNLLNRSEHLLIIQWLSHHCHWPSKVNTRWHTGQNNGDSCMHCPIRQHRTSTCSTCCILTAWRKNIKYYLCRPLGLTSSYQSPTTTS